MADFFLYAVLMSDAAVDVLTTSLVKAGYTVGAAAASGTPIWPGEVSTFAALKVCKNVTDKEGKYARGIVLDEIAAMLSNRGIVWHVLLIQHGEGTTWHPSNIKLPAPAPKTDLERIAKDENEIG